MQTELHVKLVNYVNEAKLKRCERLLKIFEELLKVFIQRYNESRKSKRMEDFDEEPDVCQIYCTRHLVFLLKIQDQRSCNKI